MRGFGLMIEGRGKDMNDTKMEIFIMVISRVVDPLAKERGFGLILARFMMETGIKASDTEWELGFKTINQILKRY